MIDQLLAHQPRRVNWVTVVQCAWCGAIRLGPRYFRLPGVEKFTREWTFRLPTGSVLTCSPSHGICPECAKRVSERSGRA